MLRIGPFQFEFPVVQAALSGYSDAPMRLLARRFGAPFTFHEVVLDKSVVFSEKVRHKILGPLPPADHPIAGQLMGAEPTQFAAAAAMLVQEGYDVVDINFGCPVKKVLGRCRGGFLLSDPPTAVEILRAVRAAVPAHVPVTLKMRRGMDDSPESEHNFWHIFDTAFDLGLAAITVHGRTVRQRYIGRADWNFLARVKRRAGDRTILGSGDLYTAHDVQRMLSHTGVDGVTLARGCIGNPWLFRECRAVLAGQPLPEPPSVAEQGQVIADHYRLCAEIRGADYAPRIMRKFGIKYAELHPHPKAVRMAFVAATSAAKWQRVLDEWYDPARDWPPGRRKLRPETSHADGCAGDDAEGEQDEPLDDADVALGAETSRDGA
ncbi:MAG: tRNA-dihydrouridine synthase [Planctomycetota bacterium]